jgi:hypothetical protein
MRPPSACGARTPTAWSLHKPFPQSPHVATASFSTSDRASSQHLMSADLPSGAIPGLWEFPRLSVVYRRECWQSRSRSVQTDAARHHRCEKTRNDGRGTGCGRGDGWSNLELYPRPKSLPDIKPTLYCIESAGQPGQFSMPTWHVVHPNAGPWRRRLRGCVKSTAERDIGLSSIAPTRTPRDRCRRPRRTRRRDRRGRRRSYAARRAAVGSVTQRLLHVAFCPVLIVPPARETSG